MFVWGKWNQPRWNFFFAHFMAHAISIEQITSATIKSERYWCCWSENLLAFILINSNVTFCTDLCQSLSFLWFAQAEIALSIIEENKAWNYISCALKWRVDMLTVWAHYSLSEIKELKFSMCTGLIISRMQNAFYTPFSVIFFYFTLLRATVMAFFTFLLFSCSWGFIKSKPQKITFSFSPVLFYSIFFSFDLNTSISSQNVVFEVEGWKLFLNNFYIETIQWILYLVTSKSTLWSYQNHHPKNQLVVMTIHLDNNNWVKSVHRDTLIL